MRGDRIIGGAWSDTDTFVSLPGGQRPHRVRYWVADDIAAGTYRLTADPTDGEVVGLEVQHLRDDDVWCGGYVAPDTDTVRAMGICASGHRIVSVDPLTIEPSLACKQCPSHGFVKAGTWVGAPD